MSALPTVAVGQIWKERDTRHTRFVLVREMDATRARVVTCTELGAVVGTRSTWAKLSRFGKSRGYELIGMLDVPLYPLKEVNQT